MRKRFLATRLARIARQLAVLLEQTLEEMPDDDPLDILPAIEQAILTALEDGRPRAGKQIAKATGYAYCPRLRKVLADLTRRGLLVHGPEGYKLASRPAPPVNRLNGTLNGHG